MRLNCMHCVTWMIQENEQHKHLINEDELWSEAINETSTQGDNYIMGNARIDLLDIEEIRRINENTLSEGFQKSAKFITMSVRAMSYWRASLSCLVLRMPLLSKKKTAVVLNTEDYKKECYRQHQKR